MFVTCCISTNTSHYCRWIIFACRTNTYLNLNDWFPISPFLLSHIQSLPWSCTTFNNTISHSCPNPIPPSSFPISSYSTTIIIICAFVYPIVGYSPAASDILLSFITIHYACLNHPIPTYHVHVAPSSFRAIRLLMSVTHSIHPSIHLAFISDSFIHSWFIIWYFT